jgi:hypothetical protein
MILSPLIRRRRRRWTLFLVVFFCIYVARTIRLVLLQSNTSSYILSPQNTPPEEEKKKEFPTATKIAKDCWTLPPTIPYAEFHPKRFMEQGPGKAYLPLYEKQLERKKRRLLKIRLVVYSLVQPETNGRCRPVYYHIHKNGGSTMNVKGDHPPLLLVDAYYTPREQNLGREEFHNQTLSILTQLHESQHQQLSSSSNSMPFFTFLRDPVTRFLSSVGQALRLNKLHPCNTPPKKGDTLALLECVLQKIQDKESFLDEHLVPQALELYHGMMGLDLQVQVMDLSAIGPVLQHLVVLGLPTATTSTTSTTSTTTTSIETRRSSTQGRLVAGFNLSTALLTPSLVQRICTVYQMDSLMLKQVGVTNTMCP